MRPGRPIAGYFNLGGPELVHLSRLLALSLFIVCAVPARAQDAATTTPPEVTARVEAIYPPDALAGRREATVVLLVTVDRDGAVADVEIGESGGTEFDEAAIAAVRQWRFTPAQQGGKALASKIRIPFAFQLPAEAPEPPPAAPQAAPAPPPQPATPAPAPAAPPAPAAKAPAEVTVQGQREVRSEERSSSDFHVSREVIAAAPRHEGSEVLRTAPGMYMGRAEGPAVAPRYMLRGFDADHGQDIEFRVGGLPINLPSHVHGQGYADLGFLIGETVHDLRVSEGVYDPRQGDFAVAGSIDIELDIDESERGVRLKSGYGSFDTFRQLVLWAPREAERESFGAFEYTSTDGFGENRAGKAASAILQHRFGAGKVRYRAIGILHAARSDLAGVLRADDVEAGRVCFYCVYPVATARAQNALANRVLAGFFADVQGEQGENGQVGIWLGYDNFRLQENFSGFVQRSQTLAQVSGRGDLIEQLNRTSSIGFTARYRTAQLRPAKWARGTLEVGGDGRLDSIDQGQNLLDATVRNQTWDRRVDASIRGVDIGMFGDLDFRFTRYLRTRFGIRADVLSYDIDDRLGNFAPLTRPDDDFIVGFRRSALGVAWGPRTSLEVSPWSWLSLLAAYGEGYRSPQARVLDDGEDAPFAKVRSADVGLRFDWDEPFRLTLGGYYTRLSDDVAFDADEGRLERIGETERLGACAHAESHLFGWFVGALSFTYVDATLLEPPPPTPQEPQPPFETDQNLPFVPPIVVRADLGAQPTLVDELRGFPLVGKAGVGFSFLSARPLPYGTFAEPLNLFDAGAGLAWGPLELGLEVFNVLGSRYAAVEYNFASNWDPNGVRPRVPTRHIAAGAPRSWMLTLGVTL